MSAHIPESGWRQFKQVHQVLVEEFCRRVLDDVAGLARSDGGTAHEKRLRVYKLIEQQDKELGRAFDDFRRSAAIMQLGIMRSMGLLTDEQLRRFTAPTQEKIEGIASIGRD